MIWLDNRSKQIHTLFALIFIGGLLIRVWAAVISHGFTHPDEHYQILEPAHGLVYGYWDMTWEWIDGIRPYLLPSVFASWIDFYRNTFKTEDPIKVIFFLRLLCGIFSLATLYAVYRVGRIFETDRMQGWISLPSAFICAITSAFVYYSVRTLSEPLAMNVIALCVMIYFLNGQNVKRKLWNDLLIGLLVGLAFSFRFQAGIFGISFFLLFLFKRNWKSLGVFCLGAGVMLIAYGLYDMSMGRAFLGSALGYFEFNILNSGASNYGVAPWHRYITALNRFFTLPMALWMVVGLLLSFQKSIWQKSKDLWVIILPFWLVHNFIGHKEDRFIVPLLPWISVLAVYGWVNWMRTLNFSKRAWSAVAYFTVLFLSVVYGYSQSSWTHHGEYTKKMGSIHHAQNLKGLAVVGTKHSGSYFYLHQNIPLEHFSSKQELDDLKFDLKVPEIYPSVLIYQNKEAVFSRLGKRGVSCEPDTQFTGLYRCARKAKQELNG